MLEQLHIRDVGVIEDVTLDLAPGLNVLTGETGAGKTMVVASIGLLLGGRADADQVRTGASRALIEGRLHPPPPGGEAWLDSGDEDLVVSREVVANGQGTRSRARIGGRLAPASALATVLGDALEVHGQHDSARLAQPAVQRDLLDRSGGVPLAQAAARYAAAYEGWRAAHDELERLRGHARDRARELDRLRFELAEIDAVDPRAGEEAALDAELRRLEHAAQLTAGASAAAAGLSGDGGARDALGVAAATLRPLEGLDADLDALRGRLDGLLAEVQDAALELVGYRDRVELDPHRLEELQSRRAAIAGLTRKYGPDAAAVAAYGDAARARVAELAGGDERAAALAVAAESLQAALKDAAGALREERRAQGARLAAAVAGHLDELALAGARLEVAVEPSEPGPSGADRVTFLLAANPGEPVLPLGRAASGGERSRVALAVRLALADADDTPVLVFDEIDAGIGGATALAVGRKLAHLARGRQVLCVTHLAQLAAHADAHFVVAKASAGGRTVAGVRVLDEPSRVPELARMLSGSPGSPVAAGHAAELRAAARAGAPQPVP